MAPTQHVGVVIKNGLSGWLCVRYYIYCTATDHIIRSYLHLFICHDASSGAARVGFASKAERKDARLVGVLVDLKIEFLV